MTTQQRAERWLSSRGLSSRGLSSRGLSRRLRRIETRLRRIETRLRRIETRLRRTPALRAGASVEIDVRPVAGCEHVDFDTAAYSINVLTPSG